MIIMADLLAYFGVDHGYELRWAHAANSRYLLRRAIEDSAVHMIEVDVSLGQDGATPICTHIPGNPSDLTLIECVDALWGICQPSEGRTIHRKGLKLDFKSSNAVNISSALLAHYMISSEEEASAKCCWPPLVLHADVLRGPCPEVSSSTKKSQSDEQMSVVGWNDLLEASKRLPFSFCSLGWATATKATVLSGGSFNKKRAQDDSADSKKVVYTDEMLKEMEEILKHFSGPLTLSFRACYVLNRQDMWWNNEVLRIFLGRKPVPLDQDGDVIRQDKKVSNVSDDKNTTVPPQDQSSSPAEAKLTTTDSAAAPSNENICSCRPTERRNVSFLLWSHSRDDVNSDGLQQFVLKQSLCEKSASTRAVCSECGKICSETVEHCQLLLDLNQKHMGMLDSWELATAQGLGKETMPSLIMSHVAEKYPNNKRFRYT